MHGFVEYGAGEELVFRPDKNLWKMVPTSSNGKVFSRVVCIFSAACDRITLCSGELICKKIRIEGRGSSTTGPYCRGIQWDVKE